MWINHVVPDQPWQPWLPFSRHGGASTSGSGPHQRQPAPYATSRWGPQWLRGEPPGPPGHTLSDYLGVLWFTNGGKNTEKYES